VGDRRAWNWCAPAWAAAGHRVVAYDRRGFGSTESEEESYDELADLAAVAVATGSRPAVVVGNSQGGRIAIDYALQRPADVIALVLISPAASGYPRDRRATMSAETELDELIEAAEAAGDLDQVNELEVHYWLDGVDQPVGRVAGDARQLMMEMNLRALRAAPVGPARERPPA